MVPKPAWLRLPFGARKFVLFSTLNASMRSSNCAGPPSGTRLEATRSSDQYFGPLTELRSALPNGWLGSVGTATQARLNQLLMVRSSPVAIGSQVTFGR
jgi:hypothetical protein